jgi:Xaa-Pro aminopeptidase
MGRADNLAKAFGSKTCQSNKDKIFNTLIRIDASGFPKHRGEWINLVPPEDSKMSEKSLLALMALASMKNDFAFKAGDRSVLLSGFREEMKKHEIDFFIQPVGSPAFPESAPPYARRLEFLTGFTGSSGLVVVSQDKALFITDSRYKIQSERQLGDDYEIKISKQFYRELENFLKDNMQPGHVLGCDATHYPVLACEILEKLAGDNGGFLKTMAENPVDALWENQPPKPLSPIIPYPEKYSGRMSLAKRLETAKSLCREKTDAMFVGMPENVGWLLNIRGFDTPYTPYPVCYAVLHNDASAEVFLNKEAVTSELEDFLGERVNIRDIEDLETSLRELGESGASVELDPKFTQRFVLDILRESGAKIVKKPDRIMVAKAVKNVVERENIREAHRLDGLAFSRTLFRMDKMIREGEEPDEYQLAQILEEERKKHETYYGPSFATISSYGPNGADTHYEPAKEKSSPFLKDSFYLLDAGGQYLQGTTDMTRTIATGKLDADMESDYTYVLKAHIALALAEFPIGSTGYDFDEAARDKIKQGGLDYGHSTGHGVGHFGRVHETPPFITAGNPGSCEVLPGMFFSNEPGYYIEGVYGIRTENLAFAYEKENGLIGLETVSLAPIDLKPVDPRMLSAREIAWIDEYHETVRSKLEPLTDQVDKEFLAWLEDKTRPFRQQIRDMKPEYRGALPYNPPYMPMSGP